MVKLAIFDIDFTLTNRETLIQFYKFMLKKRPHIIRKFPSVMVASLLYIINIYDLKKAKEKFISFVDGIEEKEMAVLVKEFYEKVLSKILYDDAIKMIQKLKGEGYKIFLISASPEFYLNELYNIKEVDKIIGTRYKVEDGKLRCGIEGENCKGEEKVKRLLQYIEKENIEVDYKSSYMFSDSKSDLPLFRMVGHPYLINYKGKSNDIEVLRWK